MWSEGERGDAIPSAAQPILHATNEIVQPVARNFAGVLVRKKEERRKKKEEEEKYMSKVVSKGADEEEVEQ